MSFFLYLFFFFQAEDGIRDIGVTGVQTCALPISPTTDAALSQALLDAINNKTKPLGSLGRLETLAARLGLIQGSTTVRITDPAILVFAGDHGVVAEGVSA